MTLHIMTDKELTRLDMLRDLTSGRLTACPAPNAGVRHFYLAEAATSLAGVDT